MNHDDLLALAAEATPGPWEANGLGGVFGDGDCFLTAVAATRVHADADYIAAVSPDRVTALIQENQRLRATDPTLDRLREMFGIEATDPDEVFAALEKYDTSLWRIIESLRGEQ